MPWSVTGRCGSANGWGHTGRNTSWSDAQAGLLYASTARPGWCFGRRTLRASPIHRIVHSFCGRGTFAGPKQLKSKTTRRGTGATIRTVRKEVAFSELDRIWSEQPDRLGTYA